MATRTRIPRPKKPISIRFDLDRATSSDMAKLANDANVSMSLFARIVMELLVRDGRVTPAAVTAEAVLRTNAALGLRGVGG
jgi:hypothetical protein